jgi:dynein heavy chain
LSGEIARDEWNFFLKGVTVIDRSKQPPNPAPMWISEEAWDNVTGLVVLSTFENIVSFSV